MGVVFGYFFSFWLSGASLGSTWASLGSFWAALGSCWASLGSFCAFLGSSWGHFGSLLPRIGSLLAHPGPAVPHLEPPWSHHGDSLASSWSLSWPIRLPPPLIFPSPLASGCMINSDPSWRFQFWMDSKTSPCLRHDTFSNGSATVSVSCVCCKLHRPLSVEKRNINCK